MNKQYFNAEQIKKGELNQFLEVLLQQTYGTGNYYNDIHIIPTDCGSFLVEWEQVHWKYDKHRRFEFLEEDQEVATFRELPDGTCQYFLSEGDFQTILKLIQEDQEEEGEK